MPSYSRIVKIPGKSAQELYDIVAKEIDRFMSKAAIGKVDIERNPNEKCVNVKGSLFSATLNCRESEMEVQAKLSLMAAPFKSKLDDGITRWLSKTFNLNVS